jgi:lipid-binding SYLF domain-containing protein
MHTASGVDQFPGSEVIMLEIKPVQAGRFAVCLALLLGGCASTGTLDDSRATADNAQATLKRFAQDPDMTWLHDNLPRAKAVLISPQILQAGFIVGGSGGKAVLHARTAGSPGWTGPAFYKLGTGSIGLQAGAESAEMVALVMTDKALNSFLSTDFKLGGEVSVAAGPVGAGTGAPVSADMVVYVRTKGLYGGLNLSGSVVSVDDKANRGFYGREVSPVDILVRHSATSAIGNTLAQGVARATRSAGQ